MKKYFFFLLSLIITKAGIAQNGSAKTNDKDWAYYQYRTKISEPDYSIKEMKELVGNTKKFLSDMVYQSLSIREKFTYNMIYMESYSQICSVLPFETDEDKKIFAQLPSFGEFHWSQRQENYFKSNKDSVTELMNNSMLISKRVGLNYKTVIEMINATKTIPILIEVYVEDKKDHDILTLLMLLMKKNKYAPFINSEIYRLLYGTDQSSYKTSLPLNLSNQKEIVRLANDFYYELPN